MAKLPCANFLRRRSVSLMPLAKRTRIKVDIANDQYVCSSRMNEVVDRRIVGAQKKTKKMPSVVRVARLSSDNQISAARRRKKRVMRWNGCPTCDSVCSFDVGHSIQRTMSAAMNMIR